MKKVLSISIFAFLLGCNDANTYTDINNKFEIEVPEEWTVENSGNESVSIMTLTDTTRNLSEKLLFDVSWESDQEKFTPEYIRIMDSIVLSKDWQPRNHSLQRVNGSKTYFYDVFARDSLGKLNFAMDNRYISSSENKGTIFFTVTRWKEELSKSDSILVENIFQSLEWK